MNDQLVFRPPVFDNSLVDPSLQLWQANNAVQRAYQRALRPHGLTFVQFMVMRTLIYDMRQASPSQHAVAQKLQANKVMLSQVLTVLIDKQLIYRLHIYEGRRSKAFCVTNKGKIVTDAAIEALAGIEGEVYSVLMQKPGFVTGLCSLKPKVIT